MVICSNFITANTAAIRENNFVNRENTNSNTENNFAIRANTYF